MADGCYSSARMNSPSTNIKIIILVLSLDLHFLEINSYSPEKLFLRIMKPYDSVAWVDSVAQWLERLRSLGVSGSNPGLDQVLLGELRRACG